MSDIIINCVGCGSMKRKDRTEIEFVSHRVTEIRQSSCSECHGDQKVVSEYWLDDMGRQIAHRTSYSGRPRA